MANDPAAAARYRTGLLTWLRAPDDPAGLRDMAAVVRETTRTGSGGERLQWQSAETFLAGLIDGTLPADADTRRLCQRIERQLTADDRAKEAPDPADGGENTTLAAAIFDYVSRRVPSPPLSGDGNAVSSGLPGPGPALSIPLGATADLLPLIARNGPALLPENSVQAWTAAARAFDAAWHAVSRPADVATGEGGPEGCRQAATGLLNAALTLDQAASLKLAEALATAAEFSDQKAVREHPQLRAAVAAASEIASEANAPNHPRFDQRVGIVVDRLEGAIHTARTAGQVRTQRGMAVASSTAPWTLDDARETLQTLRAALMAMPPQQDVLLAGTHWFAQQDNIAASVALRGLAVLAEQVLASVPAVVLDRLVVHQALSHAIDAMGNALDAIARGDMPQPDERAFTGLRALLTNPPVPRESLPAE